MDIFFKRDYFSDQNLKAVSIYSSENFNIFLFEN